jgi:hypothetical protein
LLFALGVNPGEWDWKDVDVNMEREGAGKVVGVKLF